MESQNQVTNPKQTLNLCVQDDQKMDQRSTVLSPALKQLQGLAILEDLVSTLGPGAVIYSSVTIYLREARSSALIDAAPCIDIPMAMDDADQAIVAALNETLLASVSHLSRLIHLSSSTIYQQLTQSLEHTARDLRWVPHILSDDQKAQRVEQSRRFLRLLEV
jgi:hypothetical protein